MIRIECRDALYAYDIYHITKAFFPNEEIEQQVDEKQEQEVSVTLENGSCFSIAPDGVAGFSEKKERKHWVNKQLYNFCRQEQGHPLAWGILTGIRPTKMIMSRLESGAGERDALEWMTEEYLVTGEKAELALAIAKREKALLDRLDYREGYSLYIGIPFCPTICSYCSFSSSPLEEWEDRVDGYLDALCRELSFVGTVSAERKLNTIYIGGGTPTTLNPQQLERLLSHLEQTFSYENLIEFTVEAGRPDSITREKLEVLKSHPVTRISINPQSMQQKTLDAIGRRHTVQEIYDAYEAARELGFDNINMDLIAGLPGEEVCDMRDTLEQIVHMQPDSLTVHSLAIKRAARMGQEKTKIREAKRLEEMVDLASDYAKRLELVPYYLYRQKNIAGNFENVGYAKVDKAGIYNILIMEEKQSIIACGAGASTKIVLSEKIELESRGKLRTTNIIRIENVKDIEEYITRIDEMIERKGEWLWH
ncbi:coproporphyrinogen dehydrogenase HemZ [Hespellia stercorisuis]|uniref:Oxygen-independent coproporphyrinogen-3 oxidase n=1 Tax=Hespellia stercorisuis DSM 15480 TaxID=1121950 RepID=A0A1M6IIY3_9FIRM|nr:coproporphyrinogen dehydrogenase HemZ [Hespellia stercorisuis]SHJ34368.1 oxygen-independent coproporphyrinogen-3 oxidase [Hespellia stercorisuis DSM 15480]